LIAVRVEEALGGGPNRGIFGIETDESDGVDVHLDALFRVRALDGKAGLEGGEGHVVDAFDDGDAEARTAPDQPEAAPASEHGDLVRGHLDVETRIERCNQDDSEDDASDDKWDGSVQGCSLL